MKGTLVKGGEPFGLGHPDPTSVTTPKGICVLPEISSERVEDATTQLKVGDTVEALIISVDRKNRSINSP